MRKLVSVTFFYQSGFAVAIGKTLLLFSYHIPEGMPETIKIGENDLSGFNNILFFVPNGSKEHLDEKIFAWSSDYPVHYIVSKDAEGFVPKLLPNLHLVTEGDTLSIADAEVTVCPSTARGVSFYVQTHGVRVFHAGDLNLWHWREESTPRKVSLAENEFYETVEKLPKERFDLCFFPLDPNQGGYYDAGANHAIMALKPRVFFPMHFGNRGEIAEDYARRMYTRRTAVCALTKPRETAQIDLEQNPPSVTIPGAPRAYGDTGSEKVIMLNTYLEDNPFADTDLPVDI